MTDDDAPLEGLPQQQLRAEVSVLGGKFLQRTRGEVAILRELVEGSSRGDSSALARLQELAHKIHGSGAMFGFEAISKYGEEIEHLGEQIAATGISPAAPADPVVLQQLRRRIEQLSQAVETACLRPARD
jgi:HPt (histidine-containing phosphotransfer) domain-containing protein